MSKAELLKKKVFEAVDASGAWVREYTDDIAANAELGFHETRTSGKLAERLESLGLNVKKNIALTGLRTDIGTNKGPKVALIGELDGIVCRNHPQANPVDGASHSCGHNLQTSIILTAAAALKKSGIMDELDGSVALMAVPAEEFIEIDRRKKMRDEGKIRYLCGKPEFVRLGEFDDVDMAMMIHAGEFAEHKGFAVPYHGNGFRVFMVRYEGKQAHAAAAPDQGINALYAAVAGINAVNALRETFRDNDHVRVHFIITKGGDSVNSVPDDVRLEGYVRAASAATIDEVFSKVEKAFKSGADALGCKFHFTSIPGDMPLAVNQDLNALFAKNAAELAGAENVDTKSYFSASTDMGDICHLMPGIHPSAGGSLGALHSAGFHLTDFDAAVLDSAKALLSTVIDLLCDGAKGAHGILDHFKPIYTKEEYLAAMDARFSEY
ncbi:MAG: amidohydrolase [Pyramidobacter sp.]|nr:amidohydrolase [Pyramidobacter sp.]